LFFFIIKFNWEYELRENIYLNAKDKFIDQFGNEKDWYDGNMSWVFWCVCDKTDELVEQNLIKFYNKKEQANEKNNSKHS